MILPKRHFQTMKQTISLVALSAAMLLSSCVTTVKTARIAETSAAIKNVTVADLKVTDHRITYTMTPTKSVQRAGLNNVKQAAVQEALTQNGNADVMVEPEFVIEQKRTLFGSRISSITVTGRPAYYQNFRTLPDSVWHKPGFYGQPDVVCCKHHDDDDLGYDAKRGGIAGLVGKLTSKSRKSDVAERDFSFRRSGLGFQIDLIGGYERTHFKYEGYVRDDYKSDGAGYIGALGTIGVQTTPHWFFGVGSGYMHGWDYKTDVVPIFGDVRYYFSPRGSSFFIDYKVGGSFSVGNSNQKGGVMMAPAIGYSFGAVSLAVQYVYQQFKADGNPDLKINSDHFGLSIGFKI